MTLGTLPGCQPRWGHFQAADFARSLTHERGIKERQGQPESREGVDSGADALHRGASLRAGGASFLDKHFLEQSG